MFLRVGARAVTGERISSALLTDALNALIR